MNSKKTFTIIDNLGNEVSYEILLAFYLYKTDKHYLVYTDNKKDKEGNLKVYAAIYYPNDNTKLENIKTKEEWDEVRSRLNDIKEV